MQAWIYPDTAETHLFNIKIIGYEIEEYIRRNMFAGLFLQL